MASKNLKLDVRAVEEFAAKKGLTFEQMSDAIGRSRTYISNCLYHGKGTSEVSYNMLAKVYGLRKGELLAKSESAGASVEAVQSSFYDTDYTMDVDVGDSAVRLILSYRGVEIGRGVARIKGDEELDVYQAISYAAHQLYKRKEQEILDV